MDLWQFGPEAGAVGSSMSTLHPSDIEEVLLGRVADVQVMLVAAHPDDEVIGAGSRLPLLPEWTLVHVTDGAPRDMYDARRYGFQTREDYASARSRELECALQAGQVAAESICLGIVDQEASTNLRTVSLELRALIAERQPQLILTHPYEGGHPDHDGTAFAVHAAVQLCQSQAALYEFTSYHSYHGVFRAGEFLSDSLSSVLTFELDSVQQKQKARMLACFLTQQEIVAQFGTNKERFRAAPAYNFSEPPHEGTLYYEQFKWGMSGERFRKLAREAARELQVSTLCA